MMEDKIIKIFKENNNYLTMDSIKFFYSKLIHPKETPTREIEKIINNLLEKGIIEKSRYGETYYNLKFYTNKHSFKNSEEKK